MNHNEKFYLINIDCDEFAVEHIIIFDMPSFCSGDYEAEIFQDEKGLYILKDDNYFDACRDFYIEPK